MEFFGITMYGPQNYIHDVMIDQYKEPMIKEEVQHLMERVKQYSTLPKTVTNTLLLRYIMSTDM